MRQLVTVSTLGILICCSSAHAGPPRDASLYSRTPLSSGNCGASVIEHVIRSHSGVSPTRETVLASSGTRRGLTTVGGLIRGLEAAGWHARAVETSLTALELVVKVHPVIVLYTKNKHYAVVRAVDDTWVYMHDPAMPGGKYKMARHLFARAFSGVAVVVSRDPLPAAPYFDMVPLTARAKATVRGGSNCQNVNGDGGQTDGEKSTDPVILSNGDLTLSTIDFDLPEQGLPLVFERTYNAQTISDVPDFRPDAGTTSWVVENGEYSGAGDRSLTTDSWADVDVSVKMKTVDPGTAFSWHVAWLNFRYASEDNRYYVLLHKNGTLELTRFKAATQSFLKQASTGLDPTAWHLVRVRADGADISVWVDGTLYIQYTDANPLLTAGRVALESYYSHSHFDDLSVTDLGTGSTKSWTFSVDDNDGSFGHGWRHSYEAEVVELCCDEVVVRWGTDRRDVYTRIASGSYTAPAGVFDVLTKDAAGFQLRSRHGTVHHFSTVGELQKIVDRNGNTVTLTYGTVAGKRRILRVRGQGGRELVMSYNANGHISRITDPLGRHTDYVYDSNNLLVTVLDRRGNARKYTYYPTWSMASFTDRKGATFNYTYYYNNRVANQTGPDGAAITFNYLWDVTEVSNAAGDKYSYQFGWTGQLQSVTDPLGNITSFLWNSSHLLDKETNALGNSRTYLYDARGNRTMEKDPKGYSRHKTYDATHSLPLTESDYLTNTYTNTYDVNGNLVRRVGPANFEENRTVDAAGNMLTRTDSRGFTTTYSYNSHGQVIDIADPYNYKTRFQYDSAGRLTRVTDAAGYTTQYAYDAEDNLVSLTNEAGGVSLFTYDKNGNLLTETDPQGITVNHSYDVWNNNVKTTNALGQSTTRTFQMRQFLMEGNFGVTAVTDGRGNTTTRTLDDNMRMVAETDALGATRSFVYDAVGNLTKVTDGNGNLTTYAYDACQHLVSITFADGSKESYDPDPNGSPRSVTRRDGSMIIYKHDDRDRLTQKTYPDSSTVKYVWDHNSNLVKVIEPIGTTRYIYNKKNRPIWYVAPDGDAVRYAYDRLWRVRTMTYPDGYKLTYSYTRNDRLSKVEDSLGRALVVNTWNTAGRRTKKVLFNGVTTRFIYNAAGRLIKVENKLGSTVLSQFRYYHDKVGNRFKRVDVSGWQWYTYNATYQLKKAIYASDTEVFTYNKEFGRKKLVGGGDTTTYTFNSLNQILTRSKSLPSANTSVYTYDLKGNLVSESNSVLGNRNYTHDYDNRLTKYQDASHTATYACDFAGRRLSKTVDGITANFVHGLDHVILEKDGTGAVVARYVYGGDVDEILLMKRGTSEYFYTLDGLGSVRDITDSSGAVVERNSYKAFGATTITNASGTPVASSSVSNPHGFTGRTLDPESGLYFYRARYYDPQDGRFIEPDPLLYVDSFNTYAYVRNNPINLRDSSGLLTGDDGGRERRPNRGGNGGAKSGRVSLKILKQWDHRREKWLQRNDWRKRREQWWNKNGRRKHK